jgi:hypothetical protein
MSERPAVTVSDTTPVRATDVQDRPGERPEGGQVSVSSQSESPQKSGRARAWVRAAAKLVASAVIAGVAREGANELLALLESLGRDS